MHALAGHIIGILHTPPLSDSHAQCSLADVTHLVTIGEGKFYSTGVDVGVVRSPSNHRKFLELLSGLQKLLARLLTFPLVTVAAINGQESHTDA